LTLIDVKTCAVEAERLFQQDPYVVSARVASGWGDLVEVMENAGASVVGDLGAAATSEWEAELGFSGSVTTWDDRWPRERAAVERAHGGS
jgi:hypothetical protein